MFLKIFTISKFTIIESMRNRLLWLSLLVVMISFGLVEFIGDLAITEHRVTQVAVLAAFLRLSAVVIVTMFVVSSTVRELQDKTLEMILAMPIHRGSYYLGKLTGFIHVAGIIDQMARMCITDPCRAIVDGACGSIVDERDTNLPSSWTSPLWSSAAVPIVDISPEGSSKRSRRGWSASHSGAGAVAQPGSFVAVTR